MFRCLERQLLLDGLLDQCSSQICPGADSDRAGSFDLRDWVSERVPVFFLVWTKGAVSGRVAPECQRRFASKLTFGPERDVTDAPKA